MHCELSPTATVAANAIAWLLIQVTLAVALTLIRPWVFSPRWFRPIRTRFYEEWLHVRKWKRILPDGAAWIPSGYSKRQLHDRSRAGLLRFAIETRGLDLDSLTLQG